MRVAASIIALGIGANLVASSLGQSETGQSPSPPAKEGIDFIRDVEPILRRHCLDCHGPGKQRSSYRVDVKSVALKGGDSLRTAIVPGKSAESRLIQLVSGQEADLRMPPRGDGLGASEIELLRAWIDQGASWPDSASADIPDPKDWWSLQSLSRPEVPAASDAAPASNPIDAFIQAELARNGLAFAPEADRRTLIRRLYFDLLGLPPAPEEVAAFVADPDPQAYEKLVERLLGSPHYGERWARHWLDVVHYGDTHGYDKDKPRPNAWPYRDYVIRSFNADKPYWRFVQEQVAGDVLFPYEPEGIEALGFIAAGPWDFIGHEELPETKIDGKIARHLDRDDMVANTIGTFVSLTVHCAQCHDHKFDPIPQEDYYRLQAVFAAVDRTDRKYHPTAELNRQRAELEGRTRSLTRTKEALDRAIVQAGGDVLKDLNEKIAQAEKAAAARVKKDSEAATEATTAAESVPGESAPSADEFRRQREEHLARAVPPDVRRAHKKVVEALAGAQRELNGLPDVRTVYIGTVHYGRGNFRGTGPDNGRPRPIHLLARGDVNQPGPEVAPGALGCVSSEVSWDLPPDHAEGERRATLARWLTDPSNPLTWRSIVNRIWQHHFGRGLVDTPNDFGRMGSLPSHPELLDWLAVEFRDNGQSFKKLDRLIVTSRTYRQSMAVGRLEERLFNGMPPRRLDAESVRDSILAVSGRLDRQMYGPAFQDFVVEKPEHSPHYQYHLHDPEDARTHRRAIYRFLVRSQQEPFMVALDCADPSMRVDRRNETLTPLQALALLNSRLTVAMAKHFAHRVEREAGSNPDDQVRRAFALAVQREPNPEEAAHMLAYAQEHGLAATCRLLFNLNEFVFVD